MPRAPPPMILMSAGEYGDRPDDDRRMTKDLVPMPTLTLDTIEDTCECTLCHCVGEGCDSTVCHGLDAD